MTSNVPTDARLTAIERLLKRVERRLRLRELAALAPAALTLAMVGALALAGLGRQSGRLPAGTILVCALLFSGAALATVALYSLLRPRDRMSTARRADHALRLDERLATALEDASMPQASRLSQLSALREAQLSDAAAAAAGARPERAIPLRPPFRTFVPPVLLAVAVAIATFVPLAQTTAGAVARTQVAQEQRNIDSLRQVLIQQPGAANDAELQQLLDELARLSDDLASGDLTREEAVARLSETEERLQQRLDPNSAALREALDAMGRQMQASDSNYARRVGDALAKGDTTKAAEELGRAAGEAEGMSPEERSALGNSLRDAQKSVAGLDAELANRLGDAATALESGSATDANEALSNLSEVVESGGQKAASQEQLQQALSQLQQSKANIARSGEETQQTGRTAAAQTGGTPGAEGSQVGSTALSTPGSAAVSQTGTPGQAADMPVLGTPGSPIAGGTPPRSVAASLTGTPLQPSGTGTPLLAQGTPGQGTPEAGQGGAGQQGGQQGGQQSQQGGQGQQGQQSGGQPQAGPPAGGWGVGHQEPVYTPPSGATGMSATPVTVKGQEGPGGEQSTTSTNADANSAGPALVPYVQVYGDYSRQAGAALDEDYIPQGYKDLVRDYFTGISP